MNLGIVESMGAKTCPKCERSLSVSAFSRNASRSDGLQSWCRECKKVQDTEYYQRNKPRYLAYNRKQYAKLKEELAALKSFPCADCHGVFPPYVMDFDHLDATLKRFDVGRARKYSLDEIKREIAKCELVCANCHRIRTHERRQAPLV